MSRGLNYFIFLYLLKSCDKNLNQFRVQTKRIIQSKEYFHINLRNIENIKLLIYFSEPLNCLRKIE